jgi:hypothetical protein
MQPPRALGGPTRERRAWVRGLFSDPLAAARLGCNLDYDKLQDLAESHRSLRQIMGNHARLENFWNRKQPLPKQWPIQSQTHGGEIRWQIFPRRDGHPLIGLGNKEFEIKPTGRGKVKVTITSTPPIPGEKPTVETYQFDVE